MKKGYVDQNSRLEQKLNELEETKGKNKEKIRNLKKQNEQLKEALENYTETIYQKNIEVTNLMNKVKSLKKQNGEMNLYIQEVQKKYVISKHINNQLKDDLDHYIKSEDDEQEKLESDQKILSNDEDYN